MVALSFKKQFASDVENRVKRQSLRPTRRFKVGDRMQLYTGMRTKACRKLVEPDPVCTAVKAVAIGDDFVAVDGSKLDIDQAHALALADGFDDVHAMRWFFRHQYGDLPVSLWLCEWDWD